MGLTSLFNCQSLKKLLNISYNDTDNKQNPPGENFSGEALSHAQLDREQRRKIARIIMKCINRLSQGQNCHAPLQRCKGMRQQALIHQV